MKHDPACVICSDDQGCIDAALQGYVAKAKQMIVKHGFMVQGVMPDEVNHVPGYSYTIGLIDSALSVELYACGLPPQTAQTLFNGIREQAEKGAQYSDGSVISGMLKHGYCLMLCKVTDPPRELFAMYYNVRGAQAPLKVLQMVYPDPDGLFPWNPDFNPAIADAQRLLFTRQYGTTTGRNH